MNIRDAEADVQTVSRKLEAFYVMSDEALIECRSRDARDDPARSGPPARYRGPLASPAAPRPRLAPDGDRAIRAPFTARACSPGPSRDRVRAVNDMGDLIAVGLLGQPNASGLTANQAHEIGERVASRVAPLDAALADALAALPEGCTLKLEHDPSITDYPTSADVIEYAEWSIAHIDAESPVAALRALTAKLRERAG